MATENSPKKGSERKVWNYQTHQYEINGKAAPMKERVGKKKPLDRELVMKAIEKCFKPNYTTKKLVDEAEIKALQADGVQGADPNTKTDRKKLDQFADRVCYDAVVKEGAVKVPRKFLRTINQNRPNNMYYSCIRMELYREGYGPEHSAEIDKLLNEIKELLKAKGGDYAKVLSWKNEVPPPKHKRKAFTIEDLFAIAKSAIEAKKEEPAAAK